MIIKFLQARNGDSILISFEDDKQVSRNILIDGGLSGTYFDSTYNKYGALKFEIDKIKDKNEKIDLLVLSHIDNDHIEGLLRWFSIDAKAHELVDRVWFNSGKSIAENFKKQENKDLKVELKVERTTQTGVPEAIEFEEYLLKHNLWDKKIIKEGSEFDFFGAKLTILTPTNNQLKKLVKEYKLKTGDPAYTAGKMKDWDQDVKGIIEKESQEGFRFAQDTSVKNGSSITILLTFAGKNFLFLADSHPKQVLKSLNEIGYTKENPVEVELLQIPHHGSKANMHKELLEIVNTDNYVISTDSSSYGHPHKATLARIISVDPEAIIHFNYSDVRKQVFTKQDFKDFPAMKTRLITEYIVKE